MDLKLWNEHDESDVPARLVNAAIYLYGERGTQAVSNREIQRHAGVLNEAAVRYYFKSKQGLLKACLQEIHSQVHPLLRQGWIEIGDLKRKNACQVKDITRAFVTAFHSLFKKNPNAVKFLARLIREEGREGQELLISQFGQAIWRFEDDLRGLLPTKSKKTLRLHAFIAINITLNGLVDQSLLWSLPPTAIGEKKYTIPPR